MLVELVRIGKFTKRHGILQSNALKDVFLGMLTETSIFEINSKNIYEVNFLTEGHVAPLALVGAENERAFPLKANLKQLFCLIFIK